MSTDVSLGTALLYESPVPHALKIDITTKYKMPFFIVKIILILISLVLGMVGYYVIFLNKNRLIPLISFCIITCQLLCKFTETFLGNEAYFEMGGAYILNLMSGGVSRSGIGMDDAGYWPMYARIWGMIFVNLLHVVRYAPLLLELVSVITIAGILAFFTSELFDDILDIKIRFLFSLILGCTQLLIVQSQIVLIINVAYFGIILVGYLYLLPLETAKRTIVPWCALSGIIIMSKGGYLVLLPVLIPVLIICLMRKQRKTLFYTLYLLGMIGLQFLYMSRIGSVFSGINVPNIFTVIRESIWLYLLASVKWMFQVNTTVDVLPLIVVIIIVNVIALMYVVLLYSKGEKRQSCVLLASQAIAFGQILMCQLKGMNHVTVFVNEPALNLKNVTNSPLFGYEKNTFLIPVFFLFFFIIVLINSKEKTLKKICIGVLLLHGIVLLPQEQYGIDGLGNWTEYSKQVEEDKNFAFPISNYSLNASFVKKNASIVFIGNEERPTLLYRGTVPVDSNRLLDYKIPVRNSYDLSEFYNKGLIAVYANKAFISQTNEIHCLFLDKEGNLIRSSPLIPPRHQKITGVAFIPEETVNGVSQVQFCDDDGNLISLKTGCYFIYE